MSESSTGGQDSTTDGGNRSSDRGSHLLELSDVHTYYGESHILEGVSLHVDPGETVALVGRNGVGKTTTLRTALQLTPPREGTVRLRGEDVTGSATHEVARAGMGWIPEDRRMFSQLSVEENIRVAVKDGEDVESHLDTAFSAFPDLVEFREKKAGNLSGGQQQMVAIARGLVGENDLLLVDEPSEGLAPQIVENVAQALREVSEEASLLLVEQNFPLAMDLADRFYLMDNGQVVHSDTTDGVSADDEEIRRYLT
ncbi:ABC transporter ATP-binding protein [Haloarchaeobius sp. HME9146]|uniref:ABC transporter ATP-binding protein n=1 Tax=Haloarchaeobius sp. HME9146 TaxID=2978732 RepID=UPI0021BED0A1|nr:ABC transporter ATP-binding protein [Haloarchaeobius sp. HME9146]MCT9095081.1 ABC transporter ATP-binding protein [Haloarchaeobius sp. HME9146]